MTATATGTAALGQGPVEVRAFALTTDSGADLEQAVTEAVLALEDFDAWLGPYAHGESYLLWVRQDRESSMEYDGATLTQMHNIRHEVLHSWFGRGASPVADLHGWLDEAMTTWVVDLFPMREVEIDLATDPRPLQVGDDEWAGAELGLEHYFYGSGLLAHIAALHGADALVDALGAFYVDYALDSYRAVDLEEHLTCWFDDDGVRAAFLHTGYGLEGPPEPRPDDWCL
jgi:hypothetical protein